MTGNKEDYLKAIYKLGGQFNQVNNKDIANELGVSAPSVSEMIKKLLQEGFVEYALYKGVKLTERGASEATKILRRHFLWEVFLVEKLGYKWDEIDEVAELLEHVTNPELEDRLDRYLNYPKTCPHGNIILESDRGKSNYRTMDSLNVGQLGTIRRFEDIKELLNHVDSLGLNIGDNIQLINIAQYGGSMTIRKDHRDIIIGVEAARKIYIE